MVNLFPNNVHFYKNNEKPILAALYGGDLVGIFVFQIERFSSEKGILILTTFISNDQ